MEASVPYVAWPFHIWGSERWYPWVRDRLVVRQSNPASQHISSHSDQTCELLPWPLRLLIL